MYSTKKLYVEYIKYAHDTDDTENSGNLKMGKRFELAFNQRRYINV